MTDYEKVGQKLVGEGFFLTLHGPSGFCPVYAEGTLPGGEVASFRARGTNASLEVRREYDLLAHYREVVAEWPHAGYLPAQRCYELIVQWLGQYKAEQEQGAAAGTSQ